MFTNDEFVLTFLAICFFAHEGPFYLITSHPWTKYCVHKWWICAHVSSYLLFCTRRTFFTLSRVILWTKYCVHKWWICAHVSSYLLFCTRRTFFTLSRVIREPNIVFTNDEFVLTFPAICFFAHEGPFLPYHESSVNQILCSQMMNLCSRFQLFAFLHTKDLFYLITSHPWTKYCVHKWWICAYVSSYLLFCTRRTFFTLSRVIREPNIVFTNDEFVLTFPAICFFAHEGPFYLITSHPWTKYCVHKWWICAHVSSYLLFCTRRTFLPYHESSVNQILCSQMMNLCLRFQLFAFLHTKDLFYLITSHPWTKYCVHKWWICAHVSSYLLFCTRRTFFTLSRVIREPNIVFTNDEFVLTFLAICFFAHEGPFLPYHESSVNQILCSQMMNLCSRFQLFAFLHTKDLFYLITSHPWTKYCVHKWWICAHVSSYLLFCTRRTFFTLSRVIREPNIVFTNDEFVLTFLAICFFAHEGPFLPYHESSVNQILCSQMMNLCSRFQLFAFLHTKDLFYLITSHLWTKYCVHKWWICAHVSSYLLFCTRRTFFTLSRVIREPNIVFTNDEFVLTFLAICFFAHEGPFLPYHESSVNQILCSQMMNLCSRF